MTCVRPWDAAPQPTARPAPDTSAQSSAEAQQRQRVNQKRATHRHPDLIAAWVADMDFPVAPGNGAVAEPGLPTNEVR